MTRFQENREKNLRVESDICAKVLKRLHKEKLAASRWLACWAGVTQFEVKNGLQSFIVNLATTHYSCRKWDISGILCAHVITCIFFNRQDAEQYVHPCYHVSTFKVCYEPIISPINGLNMWRPSGVTPVQPPIKRRPPGKLKKKRAREPNELTSRRADISKQCKAYGKLGHNRRSCKGEIGGNSSLPGTINRTNTSNKEATATRSVCRSEIGEEKRRERASLSPKNDGDGFKFEAAAITRVRPGAVPEFSRNKHSLSCKITCKLRSP
ncbi:hypothetical protein CMV_003241 [Castanea mollissima]|uniref:SWIM-type domain-containing protein n=1 Tax=Castanea mollissima TaxID=60419 RepID=A0A8J4RP53_9ROSI|nr:hypothetical protein CMV_003241 [Castanea mollissima]